mgnify:CR=1 FL=1
MDAEDLLGLPLPEALAALAEKGIVPRVTVSGARKEPEQEWTMRVVRVEGDCLTVCPFRDGIPQA